MNIKSESISAYKEMTHIKKEQNRIRIKNAIISKL